MGLGASQARLLMLTARKSDLEFQLQMVQQARTLIANKVSQMFGANTNLEPDSPEAEQKQQESSMVQQRDKVLEMEANRLTTQHEAVQTEVDAVKKVISKNIEGSFKLMG